MLAQKPPKGSAADAQDIGRFCFVAAQVVDNQLGDISFGVGEGTQDLEVGFQGRRREDSGTNHVFLGKNRVCVLFANGGVST